MASGGIQISALPTASSIQSGDIMVGNQGGTTKTFSTLLTEAWFGAPLASLSAFAQTFYPVGATNFYTWASKNPVFTAGGPAAVTTLLEDDGIRTAVASYNVFIDQHLNAAGSRSICAGVEGDSYIQGDGPNGRIIGVIGYADHGGTGTVNTYLAGLWGSAAKSAGVSNIPVMCSVLAGVNSIAAGTATVNAGLYAEDQSGVAGDGKDFSVVGLGPQNRLDGGMRFSPPATETTAARTVGDTDHYIICNTAGGVTLTLPVAATYPGRRLVVRTITADAVISAGADVVPLIGGAAGNAILAATAGKWAELVSDGTNWQIMMGN